MTGERKTVIYLASLVVVMTGLSFAAVPLYDWFCRVTGFGGATGVVALNDSEILEQTIKVRFDASLERGMPWEFKPSQLEMEIRIGADGMAFYEAYNPTNKPIAGQASYNVAPYSAGAYFDKIECFCFTEQVLMPGERVEMPVNFFVDPEIVNDPEAKHLNHITLSYTFYQIDLPDDLQASLQPTPDAPVLTQQPSEG